VVHKDERRGVGLVTNAGRCGLGVGTKSSRGIRFLQKPRNSGATEKSGDFHAASSMPSCFRSADVGTFSSRPILIVGISPRLAAL
jgi:hypothetical protein